MQQRLNEQKQKPAIALLSPRSRIDAALTRTFWAGLYNTVQAIHNALLEIAVSIGSSE